MWDQRYAEEGYAYGTEPNDFLREQADRLPPGRVLCLAEGQGRNAVFLAARGHVVTAVDASEVGLAVAADLAAERGVPLDTVQADLSTHEFGSGWDAVVMIFGHFPPEVRARVLREAVEALRPGGALLMEVYPKAQLGRGTGGPPVAEMLYDPEEVRAALRGLEFAVFQEVEREVHEGRFHSGLACVLQVLGFRR